MFSEVVIRKTGAVYTPELLSDYAVHKTLDYILTDPGFINKKKIFLIDPACGDGVLLANMAKLLKQKRKNLITLCGIDINSKAITSCNRRLQENSVKHFTLLNTNALCPFSKPTLTEGWKKIFEKTNVNNGFDVLIANPPWGADLSNYKNKLDEKYYTTLKGQVDSFELFIELALKIVKKNGYFTFIVPDSILNHGKNIIRELLITTEIKFITRLGEKIFPGINRACTIIICKNTVPSPTNVVDCFRLSHKDRKMILEGQLSFFDSELSHVHKVSQSRFANNPYKQFDIDLLENETKLIKKFRKSSKTLKDVLSSTRGVELGSSGWICSCKNCGVWIPLSEKDIVECTSCRKKYVPIKAKKQSIITRKKVPHSVPLITGSDLKRYVGNSTKWIILGKKGIDYKPKNTYQSPKILIRKTGVGLTATLDYSSAYTTQVVYILRNNKKSNPPLEFFIALINSRAYYFYLMKSFGELEWRSHPYLTQSQILSLPMPSLQSDEHQKIVKKIVSLLKPILKQGKPSKQIDLKIELLIGRIFSLTKNDYKIIFNAINESDELLPVRDLKNLGLKDILTQIYR